MPSLKASLQGKEQIKQAKNEKGWTIEDERWLQAASKVLDPAWEGSDCEKNSIFVQGVSQATWNRFRRGQPINSEVFKAFCQVLNLDWTTVIDRGAFASSVQEKSVSDNVSDVLSRDSGVPAPDSEPEPDLAVALESDKQLSQDITPVRGGDVFSFKDEDVQGKDVQGKDVQGEDVPSPETRGHSCESDSSENRYMPDSDEIQIPYDPLGTFPFANSVGILATMAQNADRHLNRHNKHQSTQESYPKHNLPPLDYTLFVGRQQVLSQLLKLLHRDHPATRISVEGVGGVGKTSLVLEAAYRCLRASDEPSDQPASPLSQMMFDAIIFTSAQQQRFTVGGILPRFRQERTLYQIFRAIAFVLQRPDSVTGNFQDQMERIQSTLGYQRTLLIVDNLEAIEDLETVRAFLYDLPTTVKVVITSREVGLMEIPLRLDGLPEIEAIALLKHQAQVKGVQLSADQIYKMYQKTGGIPAAIGYALGQLANGYLFEEMLPRLGLPTNDFCRFYLEGSIQPLRGQTAHQLLMGLSMFPGSALREAIVQVALSETEMTHVPSTEIGDGFARLQQLSLMTFRERRYTLLPLTRDYGLAELSQYPEFEQSARQRWLEWSANFLQQYGQNDWQEWCNSQVLEQEWKNLCVVVEWCIAHDRYEHVKRLWRYLKGWTHFAGHWEQRLTWTDQLIRAARQQGDYITLVEALFDQGKTLALGDCWEQATALFERAWNLCDQEIDAKVNCFWDQNVSAEEEYLQVDLQSISNELRFNLAANTVGLCLKRHQIELARQWLQRGQDLLAASPAIKNLTGREKIIILYYQAQLCFAEPDYDRAKVKYLEALKQAKTIEWQRMISYTRNWLANIAFMTGDLEEAERLIQVNLPVIKYYNDQPCIAACHKFLARIEQSRENLEAARKYAKLAKESFMRLGMTQEVDEIDDLFA